MAPELRRRILRSVRGDSMLQARGASKPGVRRWIRLGLFLGITGLAAWLVSTYRAEQAALSASRHGLEARWAKARTGLRATDLDKSRDLLALVEAESGRYRGNVQDLRPGQDIAQLLTEPAIYLRLTIEEAANEAHIMARSTEHGKDALLTCFIQAPPDQSEKALLAWVRQSYSRDFSGAEALRTFYAASRLFVATTVLHAEFGAAIERAKTLRELSRLDQALTEARLNETRPTLGATLFVLALDEAKTPGTVTELDGASPHFVRFALIDFASKSVLFRTRGQVDPAWISEKNRPRYAHAIDSCALGSRLRQELEPISKTKAAAKDAPGAPEAARSSVPPLRNAAP
jgi:hypothetical protein